MKKMVLLVGVAVVFGCGRSTVPSDDLVKGCTLGRYYCVSKAQLVMDLASYDSRYLRRTTGYYNAKPLNQEAAVQRVSQILPDSVDYVRKNWNKIKTVSIVKEGKGNCVAKVKYQIDKTNYLFLPSGEAPQEGFEIDSQLIFVFDARQHKWFLNNSYLSQLGLFGIEDGVFIQSVLK